MQACSRLPSPFPLLHCRFTFPPVPNRPLRLFAGLPLALAALGCAGKPAGTSAAPAPAPAAVQPPPTEPIRPFAAAAFAGQLIAVLPHTLLIASDTLSRVPPLGDRVAALRWADSLVGEALLARGPEVKWVLPPELRKTANRAPGIAPDPDRMGQSVLRAQRLDDVPDPLRGQLRSLLALLGGRYALVPAAMQFLSEPAGGTRAELSLVLADGRTGKILWRTITWGRDATPAQALLKAMENVLPVGLDIR